MRSTESISERVIDAIRLGLLMATAPQPEEFFDDLIVEAPPFIGVPELLAALNEEFDMTLTDGDLGTWETVADCIAFIETAVKEGRAE